MKTATIIQALLVATAAAAPARNGEDSNVESRWGDREKGWGGWWKGKNSKSPFQFTSTYSVTATPDQVIATNQTAVPGQPGAVGYYNFGINKDLDTICYNITLVGVQGDYQSPARTATHIHEAVRGRAGPPRLAFPNPVGTDVRRSVGCLTGPFTTGIMVNGSDTGSGFKVAQIEANPSGFFADVHTNLFVQGAVRGQIC